MSGGGTNGGVNLYSQNTNGSVSNPVLSLSAAGGNVYVPSTLTASNVTATGTLTASNVTATGTLTASNVTATGTLTGGAGLIKSMGTYYQFYTDASYDLSIINDGDHFRCSASNPVLTSNINLNLTNLSKNMRFTLFNTSGGEPTTGSTSPWVIINFDRPYYNANGSGYQVYGNSQAYFTGNFIFITTFYDYFQGAWSFQTSIGHG
jgi:hypothetical protein